MRLRTKVIVVLVGCVILFAYSIAYCFRPAGRLIARGQSLDWHGRNTPTSTIAQTAEAVFILENQGFKSVRILDVESGCGCAVTSYEPRVIEPGKIGNVFVKATPLPFGVRDVNFIVKTDAIRSPSIPLHLRMFGHQSPPFLLNILGDLSFVYTGQMNIEKEFEIQSVEELSAIHSHPSIVYNEILGRITPLSHTTTRYIDNRYVTVSYLYKLKISRDIKPGLYHDTLIVQDPWYAEHKLDHHVYIDRKASLRIAPTQIAIEQSKGGYEATFVIIKENANILYSIEPPSGSSEYLKIQLTSEDNERNHKVYAVTLIQPSSQQILKLVIKNNSDNTLSTLPIYIR